MADMHFRFAAPCNADKGAACRITVLAVRNVSSRKTGFSATATVCNDRVPIFPIRRLLGTIETITSSLSANHLGQTGSTM
jgi:hypothetical protein